MASWIYNLPWYRHAEGLKEVTLGDWKYADMAMIQSGFYLDPGLSVAHQGLATWPDQVSGQPLQGPKTVSDWFNIAAFTAPPARFYGNAGSGSIVGPGLVNFEMAFYKGFYITERDIIGFRAELFNIFDHANFDSIDATFESGTYDRVTGAADPRIVEFALRHQFWRSGCCPQCAQHRLALNRRGSTP